MVPTMLTLILCMMAAVAVHRIWHYEDIFAPVRSTLGAKLLIDPAWTGLWIAPLVAAVALIDHAAIPMAFAVLAGYPLLRGAVMVYDHFAPPAATCSPCEAKRKAAEAEMKLLRTFEKRVILLGADLEQADLLAQRHPKWVVILFGLADPPKKLRKNLLYHKITPAAILQELQGKVMFGGNATIVSWGVTHTQPWAQAAKALENMRAVAWIHIGVFDPAMVPKHHRLIAPGNPVDTLIDTTPALT